MKAVQYVQKLKSERSGRPKVETLGKPGIILLQQNLSCLGMWHVYRITGF